MKYHNHGGIEYAHLQLKVHQNGLEKDCGPGQELDYVEDALEKCYAEVVNGSWLQVNSKSGAEEVMISPLEIHYP